VFEQLLAYEYYFASVQLALAMAGMGATLHLRDFAEVFRAPRSFALGYVCVLVGSPFLAFGIVHALGLEGGIAIGLILIAAVPGGTMSNLLTFFARANVALSIALTAAATLTCLVSTPFVLNVFGANELPGVVTMPVGKIAVDIFVVLLIPLALGMAAGAHFEDKREAISKWCIRGSIGAILILVIVSSGSGRIAPTDQGMLPLIAMAVLSAGLFAMAMIAGRLFLLPRSDLVTVSIETCFRNTNLALLIKASVFPAIPGVEDLFADQVLYIALLYGTFGLLFAFPAMLINRRMTPDPLASVMNDSQSSPVEAA
jgi:BASS family bile acid:Na+ symporter